MAEKTVDLKPLTFKQYYQREIRAVMFTYGETFKEAKFCVDSHNIQKQYCLWLEAFKNIPIKYVKTIPDKAQRLLFIKYNYDNIIMKG